MFATDKLPGRWLRRGEAFVLVVLTLCVTAWWAEASGEEFLASGDEHPEDSDVPVVSVLPEPSPGLGLTPSVDRSSSSGVSGRLLRPPRG